MEGGGESVVTGRLVRAKRPLPGGLQLVRQPGRIAVELLFHHPAKESLARDFAGVAVAFGQLLMNELLNRLCNRDFHAGTLAQVGAHGNAKLPLPFARLERRGVR